MTFTRAPFAFTGYGPYTYQITRVTDETGRHADFALSDCPAGLNLTCNTFTVTAPSGVTTYSYAADATSPDPAQPVRSTYRLRRWYTALNPSTPYQTVVYDDLYRVATVVDILGRQTQYFAGGVAGSERWKRGDILTPGGATTVNIFDDKNSVVRTIDPLTRVTTQVYDNAGRLIRTVLPSGKAEEKTYDVRGNVLTSCSISASRLPAPCSAPAGDIVTSATYMESALTWPCVSMASCNKVKSEADGRGAVTDYDWNTTTGDLNWILRPADANGVRPRIDASYTSVSGVGGGSFTLLASKTEAVSATQNLVTAYTYNAANRYVLKSVTVDPGGAASSTTCFQFDTIGNLIGTTDPRAAGACP